jgi:dihydrofolate reductase
MKTSLIVAMDNNGGIGKDNTLLWRLPADMEFFKKMTTGKIVIMGRKTYESIPEKFRPLPDRHNIVITTKLGYNAKGCTVCSSLGGAMLEAEKLGDEAFIIGGGEVYRLVMESEIVDEMYITHVHANLDVDTRFPDFEWEEWDMDVVLEQDVDEKHKYSFQTAKYSKIKYDATEP